MENDLEKWQAKWDKVRETEAFTTKKAKDVSNVNFFGVWSQPRGEELDDGETKHWNDVYQRSIEDDVVLNEEYQTPLKKAKCTISKSIMPGEKGDMVNMTKAKIAKIQGEDPHPIQYNTVGQDSRRHVTPEFICGDKLVELHNLKKELQRLESEKGSNYAMAGTKKKIKGLKKKILDKWVEIDKLSNEISPKFDTDYMS